VLCQTCGQNEKIEGKVWELLEGELLGRVGKTGKIFFWSGKER